jgi:CRP-like cAMP-binding protein
VEQRLVAALVRLSTVERGAPAVERPTISRRLLGELVGATRESISLVLGRLSAEGLVQRDGNGLVVMEPQRLAERLGGTGGLGAASGNSSASPETRAG